MFFYTCLYVFFLNTCLYKFFYIWHHVGNITLFGNRWGLVTQKVLGYGKFALNDVDVNNDECISWRKPIKIMLSNQLSSNCSFQGAWTLLYTYLLTFILFHSRWFQSSNYTVSGIYSAYWRNFFIVVIASKSSRFIPDSMDYIASTISIDYKV